MAVHDLMLKPEPSEETLAKRRTKPYVSTLADRMSPTKAIRRKCLGCMGAELRGGKLPRGNAEAIRAVDECSNVNCPLWAFRNGKNPWMGDKRLAHAKATEEAGLKKAA